MPDTNHKLVQNADTIITLKTSPVQFALWNLPDVSHAASENRVPNKERMEPLATDTSTIENSSMSLNVDPLIQQPSTATAEEPNVEAPTEETKVMHTLIHYHVSSSQLKLSSREFDKMLSARNWREGTPDTDDGLLHIFAEDWDEDALLILLNVIHLRNRKVPRSISLETLAKIALLVDYYDCLEAVELPAEIWIRGLKNSTPIPSKHCRDLMLWMCIAWALKLPEEFAQTTAIAIKQSQQEELSTLGLPIISFVGSIDRARIDVISTIISQLHDLLEEYRHTDYECPSGTQSFECGSILYGAMIKGMDLAGLSEPYPMAPFSGISFWEVYSRVQNIRSPIWCNKGLHRYNPQHSCNLNEKVLQITKKIICGIKGLNLEEFSCGLSKSE